MGDEEVDETGLLGGPCDLGEVFDGGCPLQDGQVDFMSVAGPCAGDEPSIFSRHFESPPVMNIGWQGNNT